MFSSEFAAEICLHNELSNNITIVNTFRRKFILYYLKDTAPERTKKLGKLTKYSSNLTEAFVGYLNIVTLWVTKV